MFNNRIPWQFWNSVCRQWLNSKPRLTTIICKPTHYFTSQICWSEKGFDWKYPSTLAGTSERYCWWLKSCTTWDVWNPINNGKDYLSTGAGFQPSTTFDFCLFRPVFRILRASPKWLANFRKFIRREKNCRIFPRTTSWNLHYFGAFFYTHIFWNLPLLQKIENPSLHGAKMMTRK